VNALRFDLQDTTAFSDLLQTRNGLIKDWAKQHAKVKKWQTSGVPVRNDKERKERENDVKREEQCVTLIEYVTKLITSEMVSAFWKNKAAFFRSMVLQFAKGELAHAEKAQQLYSLMHEICRK